MVINNKTHKYLKVVRNKKTGGYIYYYENNITIDEDTNGELFSYYDVYSYIGQQKLPSIESHACHWFIHNECTKPILFEDLPQDVQKHLLEYLDR